MLVFFLVLPIRLVQATPICSAPAAGEMDVESAYRLGKLALLGTHFSTGALDYSPKDQPDEDGFFVMQGVGRQSNFGWFAVNAWTGDVWNLGGSKCEHLTNPVLRKEQEKIKVKFRDQKEYERLSRLKPRRMYDLEFCGSPP